MMKKVAINSISKRQLRRDKMRQEIIAVSKRAFASSGYWAASLRNIADELGITAAALYNHFKNKEEILWEIISGNLDGLLKLIMAELSQDSPSASRFKNIIKLHIRYTVVHATDTKIISEDGHFLNDRYFAASQEKQRTVLHVYRACITELAESGPFVIPDVTICALYALSAVNGTSRWFRPEGKWSVDQVADVVAELILKSIRSSDHCASDGLERSQG